MCVVGTRVAAKQLVGTFAAQQYCDLLARTPGEPPERQRVGVADRLIDVPAGGIQCVDEGGLVEDNTMTGGARSGRRRQNPSLLRELRLGEHDRERVEIGTVMCAR